MSRSEILLCIFAGLLLALILLPVLIVWLREFCDELTFVKREIARTEGSEKQYWIDRKRRLWRSLIPFVRY